MITEELVFNAIEKFGIQATMLLWFMFRTETVIKKNNDCLLQFTSTIQKCKKNE
jgi:hypothetical protein